MPASLTLSDFNRLRPILRREARRTLRLARLAGHDREDVEQEMMLDLLGRLGAFDPARGSLEAFATLCFRHRGQRLARHARRERQRQNPTGFDQVVVGRSGACGDETLTLAEVLPEAAGLGPCWGQPGDAIAALERRLALERAASVIAPRDRALCAALFAASPSDAIAAAGASRATFYRRIAELRLRLLAAGIAAAA
ncbi:sigma factor [Crenalkalicoccus roseus]|uniref:sigma factor n=1 Tax=Crenalkalicoccus roseus TaxID=1485588 RepID=UPI0010807A14|nr:sigma factor [Crenalkalicoccus roseus]